MVVSIMINFVKEVLGGDYIEIFLIVYLLKFVDFCLIYICYNDYGKLKFILNLIIWIGSECYDFDRI